jgi:uncharacterized protein HemY
MSKAKVVSVIAAVVVIVLVLVLWTELQDFGAEIYRFFN